MATILEGLNKLSGALGGAETATENLEALNAIAGALGGETNATNNADAIDQIAEHASGGVTVEPLEVTENGTYTAPDGKAYTPVTVNVEGSGGDFSTAKVTFINNKSVAQKLDFPIKQSDSTHAVINLLAGQTVEYEVILYKGQAAGSVNGATVVATGGVSVSQYFVFVSGDGTITISD